MSEFVTAAEAAELLGYSETYIRRYIQAGDLSATKVKGRWQIARSDLEGLDLADIGPPSAHGEQTEQSSRTKQTKQTDQPNRSEWRDDLLAQVARLEAGVDDAVARGDEAVARLDEVRHEATRRETEAGLREERSKARVIDLERELTVRGSRMADMQAERDTDVAELRGQVATLEAKVREILEDGKNEALQLANRNADLAGRIADLVTAHGDMHARVVELQPVAEQVPMLQAAVEEKGASLSERERELGNMRQDIDAIASRPVTGPVFRLLTKGKLRR